MTTLLAFLLVLGVLIFVHELGHFLVARWYGVRVNTFSLGFGPKILKFTRGNTEYCISAVPLGGYVKMAGETTQDERQGAPDEFLSKSKWIRFQVYLAGPAMNVLLAIGFLTIVLSNGAEVEQYRSEPPVVGFITSDSVVRAAGIQVGDRIVSINGEHTPTWDDLDLEVLQKANREVTLVVERNGRILTFKVVPASVGKYDAGSLGIGPKIRAQVLDVYPGRPAEAAGFKYGDVLLAADGQRGLDQPGWIAYIRKHANKPISVEIERGGETRVITVTPEGAEGAGQVGMIINPFEVKRVNLTAVQAFQHSLQRNWDNTRLIGKTLKGLFTRETPVSQLVGPAGIAELSGVAAEAGPIKLLEFMAIISLQLALLNLLPIPVLDGGQITILAIEGIARRDISARVKEYVTVAGAAIIVALMVTVLYNDIVRLVR